MTSIDVPRNSSQRAGNIFRIQGRVTDANVGIYTTPNGKTTRVTDMRIELDSIGSDATYHLAIKTGATFTKITTRIGLSPITNIATASAVTLFEGETLTNIGDSGATNGTVDISATIEEFRE